MTLASLLSAELARQAISLNELARRAKTGNVIWDFSTR